ncbi:MAG: esterase family protein [Bifidobacteriaceae bacterium]|jgi:S-formylglutathione hydrolase FrmB|nr:esterase family protein [Bifidobacteriaceae bacterium]
MGKTSGRLAFAASGGAAAVWDAPAAAGAAAGPPPLQQPTRDLFSSLPFGLALTAAGLLVLLLVGLALRRRSRLGARRTWRWAALGAGALTLLVGLACATNAYVGWAPNFEAAQLRAGWADTFRPAAQMAAAAPAANDIGTVPITRPDTPVASAASVPAGLDPAARRQDRGGIGRFALPVPDEYGIPSREVLVYTPPGYDPSGQTAYPVLYLIHGSPGSAADWFASGAPAVVDSLIAASRIAPIIMVAPGFQARGAAESGCLDATKPGGSRVESHLHEVVRPWVLNHFPVALDRDFAAIGGMSMGGYCAVDQVLRHPEHFATSLAMPPYGEPGRAGPAMKSSQAEIDAVTPLKYIATAPGLADHPVATWFAVDAAELNKQVGLDAKAMARLLQARDLTAEVYVAKAGGHTWAMAIASLPPALDFWQTQMPRPPTAAS